MPVGDILLAGGVESFVVGVIGGYQEGGDTPQVSYSPAFGAAVAVLYQTAQASG